MRRPLVAIVVAAVVLAACANDSGDVRVESADPVSSGAEPPTTDPPTTDPTDPPPTEPPGTEPPGTDPGADDPEPDGGALAWSACEDGSSLVDLECATLTVPLDHADPDGETIDIAVARVPATGPDGDRIGSLVFNPGGPGGSGIDFLASAAVVVPEDVAARFDLVGFDPRGVGASSAVDCDVVIDDNVDLLAEGDDEAWAALVAEAEDTADSCPADDLALAPYVGTNNAARDLDLLREALGDERLSYVGFSYGTRLGATYAELFPGNVRALVLDAAVRPTTDFEQLDIEQGMGFDRALENFAEACDADPDCSLQALGPALDVLATVEADIAAAGTFATDDPDRVLTPGELSLGVASALYNKDLWPVLADGLAAAATDADGTILQVLGDGLVGRQPDGTYDNSQEANFFINCADDPDRPDADGVRERAEASASQSQYFADFLRAGTGCIGAPDPIDPLVVGPAAGAAPILVLGTTGDPATPYEWSVAMADALDSGVLYTVEAEGHTAYISVDCVEPVVNAYLLDLEVPAEGGSCTDSASDDFFPTEGESDFDKILALFDCLRENGADIPPLTIADLLADPSGETLVDLFDPSDPDFQQAVFACPDEVEAVAESG